MRFGWKFTTKIGENDRTHFGTLFSLICDLPGNLAHKSRKKCRTFFPYMRNRPKFGTQIVKIDAHKMTHIFTLYANWTEICDNNCLKSDPHFLLICDLCQNLWQKLVKLCIFWSWILSHNFTLYVIWARIWHTNALKLSHFLSLYVNLPGKHDVNR